MPANKTTQTDASVAAYFKTIADASRRKDCEALSKLMSTATKCPPKMWGASIVGFGSYHYKYESGREGDMCLVGFSSRSNGISVYGLQGGRDAGTLLARLGTHKATKGCVMVKRLSDVDLGVLEKLVAGAATRKRP
jgi:hypothetical protein